MALLWLVVVEDEVMGRRGGFERGGLACRTLLGVGEEGGVGQRYCAEVEVW